MASYDVPNVSIEKKTNEENIASLKSWATNTIDSLNYTQAQMQSQISALQSAVSDLTEKVSSLEGSD